MGRSETEILFVKSAEARMCKIWKTLPCLLSSCFTSCYGTPVFSLTPGYRTK